jgi:Skp family chaperone for outer membrane proteins
MKVLVSFLLVGALAFTACGRNTAKRSSETNARSADTTASTSAANASSIQPATDNWTELRTYSYDKRGEFNSSLSAMSAKVDAEVSQLQADASSGKASKSRQDALAEVKSAKSNFDEKSAALARASKDTWDQARDEAAAAWDKLQAALAKARSAQ